jgi:hypothetical protein
MAGEITPWTSVGPELFNSAIFSADSILNLCHAILIQDQQMGAGKPVSNDIFFRLNGRNFISVELKTDRMFCLRFKIVVFQNLLSVTRKVDKKADYSLFLNLLIADLIFSFIVDTTDPHRLFVGCHCLRRAFRSLIKSLVPSSKM